MKILIKKSIEAEARKRLGKRALQINNARKARDRFIKRTGQYSPDISKAHPQLWLTHRHFNPIWCLKNSNIVANGIYRSFLNNNYKPLPSVRIQIAKKNGGLRDIDVFSIPDTALSSLIFNNANKRNEKAFSQNSYAFRKDRNILDAINYLRNYFRHPKIFVVDFDFKDFFGSIKHAYLERAITQRNLFKLTHHERAFIRSTITHSWCHKDDYMKDPPQQRSTGVPQGTSISLFLANIAAHELDRRLEAANGVFARFSDDSVVLTNSYEDAIKIIGEFSEYSKKSGVEINYNKGGGIHMLSGFSSMSLEEMNSVNSFRYLSYQFSRENISISGKKITSIKRSMSNIIYNNLLLYLMRGNDFNLKRLGHPHFDWDLVTCVNELRRLIYGNSSEYKMISYLNDVEPLKKAKGSMAFFCLVDDKRQIKSLDGWLVDCLLRALKHRSRLLSKYGVNYIPPTRSQLISGKWYLPGSLFMETKLPSFYTAWRVARKRWEQVGAGGIMTEDFGYD